MYLTNLLTFELAFLTRPSFTFQGFFVFQRKYQLLDPSAVFCRLSIHLLQSFRPQNCNAEGKIWL